uniref:Fructan:fructan 6G-fructosyltransferase n=1 Tax=Allium cepa TaxID=4679 RepID=A0A125SXW8_ALLCE|nr:fructan:fructan 6G-fructosyltransferase [Allium cepa]
MDAQDIESRHPLIDARPRRRTLRFLSILLAAAFLLGLVLFYANGTGLGTGVDPVRADNEFPWTNDMLAWQRCGFHFRTVRNYMNDPSGPMYYKGWYHLFYQHNKDFAYWGNITWGHAVSRDLINWEHLPVAVGPDHWYDISGVWTGSIIVVSEDRVVMLFTGGTESKAQNINLAEAADPSDPLLLKWIKYDKNPVLWPPPGIVRDDFRDPNPIWYDSSDSTYHIVVGSKNDSLQHTGIALVYLTKDFKKFDLLPTVLHSVDKVGMWECVEVYPVATAGPLLHKAIDNFDVNRVLDRSTVKHVLKASMNDEWHDYYAIGTFDPIANTWTPDDETVDVGIGLRYDWGKFYASRSFFDPLKQRRIIWGYIGEVDSQKADIAKGWASLQGIPRSVLYDVKTGTNVLTWPIEEFESLRMTRKDFSGIMINKGSTVELSDIGDAYQIDIEAEFKISKKELEATIEADVGYNCSTSGGAATRGTLGPFGLLVLANQDLTENTATYFYVSKGTDGALRTHFCQDETRSSKANDIVKRVVGGTVPVLDGETFAVRILVDHSVIESFAMGGRTSTTSRAYPTEAINSAARVFLFNNATGVNVIAESVTIWQMNSTYNDFYHF